MKAKHYHQMMIKVSLIRVSLIRVSMALLSVLLLSMALLACAPGTLAPNSTQGNSVQGNSAPYMVSSAHPLATQAGLSILRRGGTAVDAALAVQAVLSLVEPQSSGLGGGAFMLHYHAATGKLTAWDGRETAPAAARPNQFLAPNGKPMGFIKAALHANAVGVPGVVDLLWRTHKLYGKVSIKQNLQPALLLAEKGFQVTPRLHAMLVRYGGLQRFPSLRPLFADKQGKALAVGAWQHNKAYAKTLRRLMRHGRHDYYHGTIARQIVATVTNPPPAFPKGFMTMADLAAYQSKQRPPVCATYRGYKVCSMGPPSSGGVTLLQILGILENFDMPALQPSSVRAVHLITEASRLAYADRDFYLADSDFVAVPVKALLHKKYLQSRARLINPVKASVPPTKRGTGLGIDHHSLANNVSGAKPSTTHFSIVDKYGNAVSMTSTIEGPFGSHLLSGGFFLNNQLTDFSFVPTVNGRMVANAIQPGKRPRSSMTPVIIFDKHGQVFALLGSPGGNRIIAYVAQTVVALLDWELSMQAAINLPRHVSLNGPMELEKGTPLAAKAPAFTALGHKVKIKALVSGLHGIKILPAAPLATPPAELPAALPVPGSGMPRHGQHICLEGGADLRREGQVGSSRPTAKTPLESFKTTPQKSPCP